MVRDPTTAEDLFDGPLPDLTDDESPADFEDDSTMAEDIFDGPLPDLTDDELLPDSRDGPGAKLGEKPQMKLWDRLSSRWVSAFKSPTFQQAKANPKRYFSWVLQTGLEVNIRRKGECRFEIFTPCDIRLHT